MSQENSRRSTKPFLPRSIAEIKIEDQHQCRQAIQNRRAERDISDLNLQICLWTDEQDMLTSWIDAVPEEFREVVKLPQGSLFCLKVRHQGQATALLIESLPQTLRDRLPQSLTLPDDLHGFVFNVAPLPPAPLPSKKHPFLGSDRMALNGDGMIYRLGFEQGKATLKTRIAKTPCYYVDYLIEQSPRNLRSTLFRSFYGFRDSGIARLSLPIGSRNQLNTAFLPTRRHLLITFDAGRPYVLDPDSLDVVEPVGSTNEWKQLIQFLKRLPRFFQYLFQPYSTAAHPVCDRSHTSQEDEFFIANFSAGLGLINAMNRLRKWLDVKGFYIPSLNYTNLVRCKFNDELNQWKLEHWQLFLSNGESVLIEQAVHQMAITKDYIILPDVAFKMETAQIFAPFTLCWANLLPSRLRQWVSSIFLKLVQPKVCMSLHIIKRSDLQKGGDANNPEPLMVKKVTLPYEAAHFMVDYENPDHQITVHVGHSNGWDSTEWIHINDKKWMPQITQSIGSWIKSIFVRISQKPKLLISKNLKGMEVGSTDLGSLACYVIDGEKGELLSAKSVRDSEKNTWSLSVYTHRELHRDRASETAETIKNLYWMSWGFSRDLITERLYQDYRGREDRVIPFSQLPHNDKPMALIRLDTEQMEIVDSFQFPFGSFARSPQFVPSSQPSPDRNVSTNGYIVCVVLQDDPSQANDAPQPCDRFWLFHADDFKHKPIYRLSHADACLGMTIHSTWLSEFQASDPEKLKSQREVSFQRDYGELIRSKGLIRKFLEKTVHDYFVEQTSEQKVNQKLN